MSSYELLKKGLDSPICLTWEITYGCNLACTHCLSDSGPRREGELTTEQCKALLDDLSRMQVFYINIGGGEPMSRPDFFEILEYAFSVDVGVQFSTNGTYINEKRAARLAKIPGVRVQVSLDGGTAATNDAVRGEGVFEKAMRGLDLLCQYPNEIETTINTALTRYNFNELDTLYEIARSRGIKLRVSRLRPSGRGLHTWDDLHPTPEQNVALYYWLKDHPDVKTGDSFFHLSALGEPLPGLNMCGAGTTTCCIAPKGDVYACPFTMTPEFWAGNVKDALFSQIWRTSDKFQGFRQPKQGACTQCGHFDTCRGGCMAASYYINGSFTAPDPECVGKEADLIAAGALKPVQIKPKRVLQMAQV
jgi:mycofactocin biosynthetic radical S-adenosylmethionine protein MftC